MHIVVMVGVQVVLVVVVRVVAVGMAAVIDGLEGIVELAVHLVVRAWMRRLRGLQLTIASHRLLTSRILPVHFVQGIVLWSVDEMVVPSLLHVWIAARPRLLDLDYLFFCLNFFSNFVHQTSQHIGIL